MDLKNPNVSTGALVGKLKGSRFVLDAGAVEGHEGAVVDTLSFPITWAGRRLVMLSQDAAAGMFSAVQTMLGTGGAMLIHREGLTYGRALTASITESVGREYVLRNHRYGLMLVAATGWGIPEVVSASADLSQATIRVRESFECAGRTSKERCAQFVRGFLAGVYTVISGIELGCEEVKCVATGDPYCEFVLSAK